MKKLFVSLCVMMLSLAAFAQKGEQGIGVNLNVTPCLESGASLTNFGISAKYQYGITNAIRVEGAVGYDFKSKGLGIFEVGANVHYIFNVTPKVKIYPLVGVGYANLSSSATVEVDNHYPQGYLGMSPDEIDLDGSESKVYVNAGAGAEYALTDHITVNLEVKYQYIKDFSRLPISLGVAYKF